MISSYKIFIQSDLNEEYQIIAKKFATEFINKTKENNGIFDLGGKTGGYKSYIRRGCYGWPINDYLVFRRISKGNRYFGIVNKNTLVVKNDKLECQTYRENILKDGEEVPVMCMCPKHKGGIKVGWRIKPEFELFYNSDTVDEN